MKRIIALLTLAALLPLGTGCSCSGSSLYANAERYTAGAATVPADAVKTVEIDWASGGIVLKHGTGELHVYESGGDALKEADRMHWWLDGSTLRIRFCASGHRMTVDSSKKQLTVEIPAGADLSIDVASGTVVAEETLELGTFELDAASGDAELSGLSAKDVNIDTASGAIRIGKASVQHGFAADTASGRIEVGQIEADTITVDGASANVSLGLRAAKTVRIDTASGDVTLKLFDPAGGARIVFDTASGKLKSGLSHTQDGSAYVFGAGAIDVRIDTASGSVTVE